MTAPRAARPVEPLESRQLFAAINGIGTNDRFVTAPGAGGPPVINVYDAATGNNVLSFLAYDPQFFAGVHLATADFTGDGVPDIVTAPGTRVQFGHGQRNIVHVFDGTSGVAIPGPLGTFLPFPKNFASGGLFVAAGDMNGDGVPDLIVAPDVALLSDNNSGRSTAEVRVFSGADGSLLADQFVYDPVFKFRGGVRVAAADFTGDGKADLLVAPGRGVTRNKGKFSPPLEVFDADTFLAPPSQGLSTPPPMAFFFAYHQKVQRGGVEISVGDVNGDGRPEVITSADRDQGSAVQVFSDFGGTPVAAFDVYDADPTQGARVGLADVNGDGVNDFVAGPGPAWSRRLRTFDGLTAAQLPVSFFPYGPNFRGGLFIAGA